MLHLNAGHLFQMMANLVTNSEQKGVIATKIAKVNEEVLLANKHVQLGIVVFNFFPAKVDFFAFIWRNSHWTTCDVINLRVSGFL